MTREEFDMLLREDDFLANTVRTATAATSGFAAKYGTPTELAVIVLMYPVVVFVVREIGLPWLKESARYSELWRQKFHQWIDSEYKRQGFDPDEAEAAGEAFRRELEATTGEQARKSWERFADLLSKSRGSESNGD